MSFVAAPNIPMYQQGWLPASHAPRFGHLCVAPKTPLHQLGWLGTNLAPILTTGASVGTKIATPGIVSAVGATGAAAGALTAGIGAGIAVLVGVLAGLWSKHEQRSAGAKAENQAINSAVQTFDAGLQAIFAAANSNDPTKNVSANEAAQQCQLLLQQFFAVMAQFTHAPGAADASNGGANCGNGTLNPGGPCTGTPGGHMCDSSCTATCCVGCQDLYPTILQAMQVFANPAGGTITACTVYSSKYGANQRSSYTLSYKPPVITASSAISSVAGDLESALGIAPSAPGSSSSSTPLLLAAAALAAWLFL